MVFIIKKFSVDKNYFKICIYVLFVILCTIIFEKTLGNLGLITYNLQLVFNNITSVLSPFIYGFFIAYFLNSIVKYLENNIFIKIKYLNEKPGIRRILSATTTYIILLGCIIWTIAYLIPEVTESIRSIILNLQGIESRLTTYYNDSDLFNLLLVSINEAFGTHYTYANVLDMLLKPFLQSVASLPNIISTVLSSTVGMASLFIDCILGLVISFYVLCEKENISRLCRKFTYTIMKRSNAEKVIYLTKTSNIVFEKFFIGKAIDSTIIGIIFFITCLFIKPPFILFLSLIIGVTNMIPYFGPFIGAVPVIFIVILSDPLKAVWITIAILIIQQFDGIILGPKILGDSTGLKPMGVIFAIIIGGNYFGVLGMFLGVPVFAVVKNMIGSIINKQYDKKFLIVNESKTKEDKE